MMYGQRLGDTAHGALLASGGQRISFVSAFQSGDARVPFCGTRGRRSRAAALGTV